MDPVQPLTARGRVVGRVAELWRYPVKAMRGERIDEAAVAWHGLAGDRRWAFVRDGQERNGFPWLTSGLIVKTTGLAGWIAAMGYRGKHTRQDRGRRQVAVGLVGALVLIDPSSGKTTTGQQLTGPQRTVVAYNRAGLPKILDWSQDPQNRTEFAYDPGGARARKRDRPAWVRRRVDDHPRRRAAATTRSTRHVAVAPGRAGSAARPRKSRPPASLRWLRWSHAVLASNQRTRRRSTASSPRSTGWRRGEVKVRTFVALGDSFTEGLDDPYGDGQFRGWADRVAERLALADPEFRYANLAVRGRLLAEIVAEQVPAALRLGGDLVSLAGGANDLLRGTEPRRLGAQLDDAVGRLRAAGSQVLLFLGADATRLPLGQRLSPRIRAFNDEVRRVAADHGTLLADPGGPETFAERRFWSADRLHLSGDGHQLVADGVLAIIGIDPAARLTRDAPIPLEPLVSQSWAAERLDDLRWARDHGLPWVGRRIRGRSTGDGRTAKRPELLPFRPNGTGGPNS